MTTTKFHRGTHSVLILTPKPKFLELIREVAKKESAELEGLYFPQEDGVYLVPPIDSFSDQDHFEAFINKLKPELLARELGKFGFDNRLLTKDEENFADYLELTLRDREEIIEIVEA